MRRHALLSVPSSDAPLSWARTYRAGRDGKHHSGAESISIPRGNALVAGTWYLVPDSWCLIPETWYLVPELLLLPDDHVVLILDQLDRLDVIDLLAKPGASLVKPRGGK